MQVVTGLQAVQWQLLGYESKPDGQPDHERPLYSMSNPNPVVNSIVRRYATDTMANLHVSTEDSRKSCQISNCGRWPVVARIKYLLL